MCFWSREITEKDREEAEQKRKGKAEETSGRHSVKMKGFSCTKEMMRDRG